MALYSDNVTRVISPNIDVRFAGFRSTTYELQQNGWQLSAEENPMYRSVRIALHHPQAGLYGITNNIRMDFQDTILDYRSIHDKMFPPFEVVQISSEMVFQFNKNTPMPNFNPIDACPQYDNVMWRRQKISDMKIFAPIDLKRTNEIIIEPDEVGYWLEKLLAVQKPGQKKIRENLKKHDLREQHTFHAQILSA